MSVEVHASGPQQSSQRRLTRMLLFVSFAWLVLSAPFALHSLAANFVGIDRRRFADRNLLARTVCFLLVYVNHAINLYFPLYCIVSSLAIRSASLCLENITSGLNVIPRLENSIISIQRAAKTFCLRLMYVNHAINFYLYCITGSLFRQELCTMFGCRAPVDQRHSRLARLSSRRDTRTTVRRQNAGDLELENIIN